MNVQKAEPLRCPALTTRGGKIYQVSLDSPKQARHLCFSIPMYWKTWRAWLYTSMLIAPNNRETLLTCTIMRDIISIRRNLKLYRAVVFIYYGKSLDRLTLHTR